MDQKPSDENSCKRVSGLKRIWSAAGNSLSGLSAAFRHEAAFRQVLVLAGILLLVAIVLPATPTQTALLILAIVLVLLMELANSAIEAVVDHTSTEHHPLAKRTKDVGSAALLVALVNCLVIWVLVLVDIILREALMARQRRVA